jgi:hypothetical protein
MHAISHYAGNFPDWQYGAEHRLRLSMLVSAAILAAILSLARLPPPGEFGPLLELVVELTRIEPVADPEPEIVPPLPVPEPALEPAEQTVAPEAAAETAPAETAPAEQELVGEGRETDWEVEREIAIKQVLDALEREASYSINPPFERARAEASVRFRASLAPEAIEAWDRVEKDQIGRSILRLGDGSCFRVLDDPSAVNQWAFENFDQHMVYCDFFFGGKKGKELPWVEIIRERYPYLRDPVAIP